jgi:formyl-CoA transferase
VQARGLLAEVAGRRFVRTPIKLHATPVELRRGPAEVGEHTREVLAEAGFGADEIEGLIREGAAAEVRKEVA